MASSGSCNTSGYEGRYLTFSWSTANKDIANNRTTINWTLKGAGGSTTSWYMSGNFKVTIDGQVVYETSGSQADRIKLYNGTPVASGSITLNHDSAGNKSFGVSVNGAIWSYARNVSGSGSWTLDSIPRQANITSAPDFNDTANPTIKYSNPAGNNVSSLQACIADTSGNVIVAYRNISKTGSSYTFSLTEAERNALRSKTPNSKTLSVRFYVSTVIGGTTYRSYIAKTMTVVNANPTFSVAYLDSNSATSAITGNNQQIVRNNSTLRINVTNAQALKYATLKTATCTVLGKNYSVSVSGGSGTINVGKVDSSQSLTIGVTVTDSRGYTTTKNLNVQVLDWTLPTAIITLQRQNNFYTPTTINIDADYSSVNNKNTITIQLRYKKTTDSSWSSYVTFQDNESQTIDLDNNFAWNIQTLLTDKFGSTTYNQILSRGMPIAYFDILKSSVGFNCFPNDEGSVEVNGFNISKSVMTRTLGADLSDLSVNTYTAIQLTTSNSVGSKLTATEDGGIQIGAGVTKVLVSSSVSFQCSNTSAIRHTRICKNSYSNNNTLGWDNISIQANYRGTSVIHPQIVDVSEGDVIYLYYYTGNSDDVIGGNSYGGRTSLTVEVVG